jgi:structural maintenance of chromosome 1
MPVTYLELENFKSYAGLQIIGPFQDFTSVIGPNGSGKSNLMDAISFVLGVQSRDLRSSQMKDLIFRPPNKTGTGTGTGTTSVAVTATTSPALSARATLVYETPATDEDVCDGGEDKVHTQELTLRFSRSISASGVGAYYVDENTVSYAQYEAALADIGILVKARNFLVFQGDVESLARKTPAELVGLVEQISGSAPLQDEYDRAAFEKDATEQATLFSFRKQKGFRSERRLLKDQKEEAERFHSLLETKAALQKDYYLWQLYHLDQDRQERESAAKELQDELQLVNTSEQGASDNLKEAKKKASAARRQTGQADKKRVQLAAQVDQLEPSIIQTTEEIKNLRKKLQQDEKQLAKKQEEAASHESKLQEIETEIDEYKKTQADLEKDYDEVKRDATGSDVHLTAEQEEEYERVREAAAAASAEPRRVLTGRNRKLESARAKAATLAQETQDTTANRAEIANDVKEFAEREEKLTKVRAVM